MPSDRRQYESVKFTFSADDLRELGQKLAAETQNITNIENEKKEASKAFAARLEAANTRVADVATKINNGYEMREVEVLVMFDEPQAGMKRILRLDNSEVIREEPMTVDEKQRGFGF